MRTPINTTAKGVTDWGSCVIAWSQQHLPALLHIGTQSQPASITATGCHILVEILKKHRSQPSADVASFMRNTVVPVVIDALSDETTALASVTNPTHLAVIMALLRLL